MHTALTGMSSALHPILLPLLPFSPSRHVLPLGNSDEFSELGGGEGVGQEVLFEDVELLLRGREGEEGGREGRKDV